jgi:hypothetical protein
VHSIKAGRATLQALALFLSASDENLHLLKKALRAEY